MERTPPASLAALREHVHRVPDVARRLAALEDDVLVDEVLVLARDLRLSVTADEVAVARTDSRREWLQRWIR